MKRFSLLCLGVLSLCCAETNAAPFQTDSIPLIHSGRLLEEGKALRAEEKYDLSIQKLLSIPQSDTNYVEMQSELILSYLDAKEYGKAIAVGESYINKPSPHRALFYVALGNAYSSNEEMDKAVATYHAGLKRYPYDYLLHYNLGVALTKRKEYDKAISQLQQAITLNPFYANSHLFLGNIMIMQGKKARAGMALSTYLALQPTNNAALVLLNNLMRSAVTYENSEPAEEKVTAFYELDLLLKSNAALDKKFKSTIAFKAPAAQQMELLLESLPAEQQSNDFWLSFYVPFLHKVNQQGFKDAFIYHILSSVDDKGVKRWLGSNKKAMDNFFTMANLELRSVRSERTATVRGEEARYSFWYYDTNKLNAIGNQIDDDTYIGPWVFYYPNGELKAEGNFTQTGSKTGPWRYYYEDGALKKEETYNSKGEVSGVQKNYYQSGPLWSEIPYVGGLMNGRVAIYYPCGQLKEELLYKDDKRHGAGTTYYTTGQVSSRYTYQNNLAEGAFTYYYKNGGKKEVNTYTADKLQGPYAYYHSNGKLSQTGAYVNEEMHGAWQGFYDDGSKRFTGSYTAGQKSGPWVQYNEDGSLLSEEPFDQKGNLHGEANYYSTKGVLNYTYTYKDGLFTAYTYYDKDGKVLSQDANAKGNFKIKAHHPDGSLRYEGDIKKGKATGLFTYYYPTGNKSSLVHFKDDVYHGAYQSFYESGQKELDCTYEKGVMQGYYRRYHKNGRIKTEGWVLNDEMEQTWVTYYPNGTVANRQYYLFGKEHGAYEQFDMHGRPFIQNQFQHGMLTGTTQLDTLGAVLKTASLAEGNGKNMMYFANSKPRFQTQLQCGASVSDLVSYYKNGKVQATTPLKNGEYNGRYKAYFTNQKLRVEGDYVDGEQNGLWTWYFESGKVDAKIPIKNGKYHGERIDFYENGQVRIKGNVVAGERMGSTLYYAPDGTLMIERVYDENGLVRYRYLDKNQQLTPFIELPNYAGTVKAYYPNGQVSVENHYKNSFMEGKQLSYYPSGKLMEVRTVIDGQSQGMREEYYADGKLKLASPFLDDELHGQEVEYHANGKVKRKTTYLFGEKEGWEITYDQHGKVLLKEYYRDGTVY